MDTNKNKVFFTALFFFFIYLLLPTRNSTIDAWCFAANVKQGESLFLAHHLFYNAIGFIWVKLVGLAVRVDTLKILISLNALFAAATLYILGLTLRFMGVEVRRIILWVAFAGSSWAIMRFATENETYIIPLFFSVLGSYFFVKGLKGHNNRNYIYSGLFAAIACLFHQVMFFWWLSLLIGIASSKKAKPFLAFTLPALLVPISYILVLVFYYNQPLTFEALMHFVFTDYYSGAAGVSTGTNSLMFTVISIIRSFFQVHGYLAFLPKISNLFIVAGVLSVGLIVTGIFFLKRIRWNLRCIKELPTWVHLLAIFLQLVFAFLSSGNAEFMVMIPVLLAIVLSQVAQNETRFLSFIVGGILVWNISFGLIPLNQHVLDSNSVMSERVLESLKNKDKKLFVLFNKPGVENRVDYITGESPRNITTGTQYNSLIEIKQRITHALENDSIVLTDCINRPKTLSRETLVVSMDNENLFGDYSLVKVDSINTLTGKYFLVQVVQ